MKVVQHQVFINRLACNILNLANKHIISLIPAYMPIHLIVEAIYHRDRHPEWHLLPHIDEVIFPLWGQLEVDLLESLHTKHCLHYHPLENVLHLGALGLNVFNHPGKFGWVMCFLLLMLISLVLSRSLVEHITGQFRCLILVTPCWIEASWLPTVLNMLVDILYCSPNVKKSCHGWFNGLHAQGSAITAFNLACSAMFVLQTGVLFLSISANGKSNSSVYDKNYQQC